MMSDMKREIKFRGKEIKNRGWVYGSLTQKKKGWSPNSPLMYTIWRDGEYGTDVDDVDGNTVGQYTGLKDKNDKDIYEGDIVRWLFWNYSTGVEVETHIKGVIEWHQGGFILRVLENDIENAGSYAISDLNTDTESDVEILGNIHDNLEL